MPKSNTNLEPREFYLRGTSRDFVDAADTRIVLDNDEMFPAHSQFLSAFSEKLGATIKETKSSDGVMHIKLPNCDARDAINFLACVYSRQKRINSVDCAVTITKIGDIFNDADLKKECDSYLSARALSPDSILLPKVMSNFCHN